MRDALPSPRGRPKLSHAAVAVLGALLRGDDAVGPLVGERLRAAGVDVLECADDPMRLIEPFAGLDLAIVVDAVHSGAAPGTVHRIDGSGDRIPSDPGLASTHSIGIGAALELARELGKAPRRVVVIGIEGRRFRIGDPLTPAVASALPVAADEVLAALRGS